ncbi:MAG: hypothetical protein P3W90_003725, partial [Paracoccus sp. (in: a-proteobacteria)]|nr:hypothetical protein [Paracoccus sp. (in: a-proteobacteria)]
TYSSWFSEEYLSVLRASLAVFDYSPRNTLWLRSRLGETPVFHVPVTPLPPDPAQMHCDKRGVLFYGDTGGTHRPPILTGLARQFDLRIEGKLFGEPMRQAIAGARVVVNLHRHAGGMLETTRVAESLSLGARVVSETSADQGDHPLLEQLIRFAPEGDVAALAAQIRAALDAGDAPPALDDVIASGQQKLFDALTTLAILPKTA